MKHSVVNPNILTPFTYPCRLLEFLTYIHRQCVVVYGYRSNMEFPCNPVIQSKYFSSASIRQ
jgi:hypothetical protein